MSNDLVVQLGAKLDQFASDMNQAGDMADSAPEIEVAQAMIEAGAKTAWAAFDEVIAWGSPTGRDVAVEVFRAMRSLDRHTPQHSEPVLHRSPRSRHKRDTI